MKLIGEFQSLDSDRRPGSTVIKLVLNVGNVMTKGVRATEAIIVLVLMYYYYSYSLSS